MKPWRIYAVPIVSASVRGRAVVCLQTMREGACDVLLVDRSTVRYQSKRTDDAELREAIMSVARERRQFG